MTDREKRKAAIDALARHIVAESVTHGLEWDTGNEAFPALAQADYDAVKTRARKIADSVRPSTDALNAACEHLAEQESIG